MPGFDAGLLKPVNGVEVLLGLAWRGAVHELEEWMARVRLIQSARVRRALHHGGCRMSQR